MEIQEAIDFLELNGYDIIPPVSEVVDEMFEEWWNTYDNKKGRKSCLKKWRRMFLKDRRRCLEATPRYVASIKDKNFQKNPLTYLNGECWEDEITTDYEERRGTDLFAKAASIINTD